MMSSGIDPNTSELVKQYIEVFPQINALCEKLAPSITSKIEAIKITYPNSIDANGDVRETIFLGDNQRETDARMLLIIRADMMIGRLRRLYKKFEKYDVNNENCMYSWFNDRTVARQILRRRTSMIYGMLSTILEIALIHDLSARDKDDMYRFRDILFEMLEKLK